MNSAGRWTSTPEEQRRMSDSVRPDEADAPAVSSRLTLWLVFAGVALMALAGVIMWWRFGPSMFLNLVTAAANCF